MQPYSSVGEEHEGKRKNELTWRIHRIHWEKNRFIYDLKYKRKVMSVGVNTKTKKTKNQFRSTRSSCLP